VTRPDISTQVRFRKQEEMHKGVESIRNQGHDGAVKILTSCPSCLQGLAPMAMTPRGCRLLVVEMAKHLLGPDWMRQYVEKANRGGIERVLL